MISWLQFHPFIIELMYCQFYYFWILFVSVLSFIKFKMYNVARVLLFCHIVNLFLLVFVISLHFHVPQHSYQFSACVFCFIFFHFYFLLISMWSRSQQNIHNFCSSLEQWVYKTWKISRCFKWELTFKSAMNNEASMKCWTNE